jgi:hypothetical protein
MIYRNSGRYRINLLLLMKKEKLLSEGIVEGIRRIFPKGRWLFWKWTRGLVRREGRVCELWGKD